MPSYSQNLPYGVGSTGSPWNAYDKSKLDELLAAKGGKLLTPDAFYKHPAKNIFGSYSTYVDWYAGGKKRKADEKQLFRSASSGNWQPTDYGASTPAQASTISAGGMATEGISGTDISGRPTMSAPGVGQVPVDYNYRDQERIERESKRRYDLEVGRAKREAYTPQQRVKLDKDVQADERIRQADERIAQGQQKINTQIDQFEKRQDKQYTVSITQKDGSVIKMSRDLYKHQNKLKEITARDKGKAALEKIKQTNRDALELSKDKLKRNFEREISHKNRKELLKLAQAGRLNLYTQEAKDKYNLEVKKNALKEKGAKTKAQLDIMKSALINIQKAQVLAAQYVNDNNSLINMGLQAESEFQEFVGTTEQPQEFTPKIYIIKGQEVQVITPQQEEDIKKRFPDARAQ